MINDYAIIILLSFYEKMAPVKLLRFSKRGYYLENLHSDLKGAEFIMDISNVYKPDNEQNIIFAIMQLLAQKCNKAF